VELLSGIGLAGYRSFGHDEVQRIAPMSKVTLVAGQNNTGKSNLLRFVERALPPVAGGPVDNVSPLDAPAGRLAGDGPPRFAVGTTPAEMRRRIEERAALRNIGERAATELMDALTAAIRDSDSADMMWVQYVVNPQGARLQLDGEWLASATLRAGDPAQRHLQEGSSWLTSQGGGGVGQDLGRILTALWPTDALPRVQTIPAFRQVQHAADGEELAFNGVGLVERLAQLESPGATEHAARDRFEAIQRFVRDVLDDPDLTITVPYQRDTINIRLTGGAVLPLEHMGTGIHEVVILATAATLLTDTLVCVEEPEIHLHPLLQRKLLHYVARETTNQYVIATHSASMLDAEVASIFHVVLGESGSQIEAASTPGARAKICADLGYRASDLVQANAIIWVEGPSDRIYLRRWIELVDANLLEGIDYSIMFYGGRLLNHLTANDPDVDDFISLRRLNRHVAIVIDSDKKSSHARINRTKQRVVDEVATEGLAWVTAGYTIENYVPQSILEASVRATYRSATFGEIARYENPLTSPIVNGVTNPDKLRIARHAAGLWSADSEWPLDLRRRIEELVTFIHRANGVVAPPEAG